jgi:hypothetical protein
LTLPDVDHVPSFEERVRVIDVPKDPAEQYQVYEDDAGVSDGLITFA